MWLISPLMESMWAWMNSLAHVLAILGFAAAVDGARSVARGPGRFLQTRTLVWLGRISCTAYLVHLPATESPHRGGRYAVASKGASAGPATVCRRI